jgi:hypothetical protein
MIETGRDGVPKGGQLQMTQSSSQDFAGFELALDLGDRYTRLERLQEIVREASFADILNRGGHAVLKLRDRNDKQREFEFSAEFPGSLRTLAWIQKSGTSKRYFLDLQHRPGGGVYPGRIVYAGWNGTISETLFTNLDFTKPPAKERFSFTFKESVGMFDLIRNVRMEPKTRWDYTVLNDSRPSSEKVTPFAKESSPPYVSAPLKPPGLLDHWPWLLPMPFIAALIGWLLWRRFAA